MSGICGWSGQTVSSDSAQQVMQRMLEGLPPQDGTRGNDCVLASSALGLRGVPKDSSWHSEPNAAAAITGYPAWTHPDLAETARRAGHAAALLQAFRAYGADLFRHLRGTFSLAVIDGGDALLAIDRMGVETLAYARRPDGTLVFGTTTDTIVRHPAMSNALNPQSIFDFFYFVDRIPAPRTIYKEQNKLLPGELLLRRNGRIEVRRYWRMPYQAANPAPPRDLHQELLERLRAAVKTTLASDEPHAIGAFLSGGLDSSTVVGMAAGLSDRPVRAFSIGFEAEGFDEMHYARIAATRFRAEHHQYYVKPGDVFDAITRIAQAYDEPFANSSAIPAYYCARLAREHGVELMLAGDGGDELFAGNKRYVEDGIVASYRRIPALLRRLLEPAIIATASLSPVNRKAARLVERARMTVPKLWSQDNLFGTAAPQEVFEESFLREIDFKSPAALMDEMWRDGPAETPLQRMLQLDLRLTLADSDIRKVNRMCGLAGVRVRYPFLDDELVEFSARIPPQTMMPGGQLRKFYKDAMKGFLPEEILEKRKHGFGLPYMAYVRTYPPMRDLAYAALAKFRERGIMRRAFIDKAMSIHSSGAESAIASAIWDMVILELWLQSRR